MTRKEILKSVIELSVKNIDKCKTMDFWNSINVFRRDYRLTDNIENKQYKGIDLFEGCTFLTISDSRHKIAGHTSLVNAIKGVVDYAKFREYLIWILSDYGSVDDDARNEFVSKVIAPLFSEIAGAMPKGVFSIVFSTNALDFCNIIAHEDFDAYAGKRLKRVIKENCKNAEEVEKMLDEGKVEEVVENLKKVLTKTKKLWEWAKELEGSSENSLKVTSEEEGEVELRKVQINGEVRVLAIKGDWITNQYTCFNPWDFYKV